jgi:hypothetical protein
MCILESNIYTITADLVYSYLICGVRTATLGTANDLLVELGVARINDSKKIIADEPISLLAAANFFANQRPSYTLRQFLQRGLSTIYDAARGLAFEHYLGLAPRSCLVVSDCIIKSIRFQR